MNRFITAILYATVVILFLSSCKEEKTILRNKDLRALNVNQIFDTIYANYINYNEFYSKFTLETSLSKVDTKGTIKIKKDSIIWVSITPMLGIEAARIIVTHDSIKVLNRLKKEVTCKDFSYITSLTGISISYETLQAMLLNELFTMDKLKPDSKYILDKKRVSKDFSLMQYNKKDMDSDYRSKITYNHTFTIDKRILRPSRIEIDDLKNEQYLSILYDNYKEINSYMIPAVIKTKAYSKKDSVSLKISYSKSKLDSDLDYKFIVPSNYKIIH